MEAIEEPIDIADAESKKNFKLQGIKNRPKVSIVPTKIDDTNAPFTEPIPPITIITNASIRTGSPIPTSTDCIVPTNAPASPASDAPRTNNAV